LLIEASCPQSWPQDSRLRIIPVSAECVPLTYSSWDSLHPGRTGRTVIPAAGDAATFVFLSALPVFERHPEADGGQP
jgi:hypothetical protein